MLSNQISARNPADSSKRPVVLSIAGYDPSAGAGVLADVKTFAALGVYGMACVTAWTVQSTQGVRRMQPLAPELVTETLECLASDVAFAAIKVGMLGDHRVAAAVLNWLCRGTGAPVVLDPVLHSSSGRVLLDVEGLAALRGEWLERVNWITPNLPELAALTGVEVPKTRAEIESAAAKLQQMAADRRNPALRIAVTGGHATTPDDLLLSAGECRWFPGTRIDTSSTHGTGCAFSSAVTARLALGDDDKTAMRLAKEFVAGALRNAYPVGHGTGPLNHLWQSF